MDKLSLAILESAKDGFTQSEMMTMDNCPQKWYYQYVEQLQKIGSFSWALVYGSALHATLEEMYLTGGKRWSVATLQIPEGAQLTLAQEGQREYYQGLVKIQAEQYFKFYKDDFTCMEVVAVEQQVDTMFEGLRLKGMIDLIVKMPNGKLWIFDHKTASRLDANTQMGWDFRFQFMFYMWLARRQFPDLEFAGFTINAIKKPALRQGKTESQTAFLSRCEFDMISEPDKYFYRDNLPMTKDALQRFEDNILRPKLNRLHLLTNEDTNDIIKNVLAHNSNTDACMHYGAPCAFLPLCHHGEELEGFQYERREHKHQELAGEPTE